MEPSTESAIYTNTKIYLRCIQTLSMEIISHLITIVSLLGLIVAYSFRRRRRNKTGNNSRAPEACGAWPILGHLHLLRGGDPIAKTLGAMADIYGSIFSLRLGTNPAIVVSSWEHVKECFTTHDKIFASRPTMAASKYMYYNYAGFALAPYGPYWRHIRKMVNTELFSNQQLDKLVHIRTSELECFIKDLHVMCTKNKDLPTKVTINKLFELFTFNIIINMVVGKRFSAENNSQGWHLREMVSRVLYLSGVFVVSDAIPGLEWLDVGGYIQSMKRASKDFDEVVGGWLEEHIQKRSCCDANGDGDFMDMMLSSLPKEALMSGHDHDTIIKATTSILIWAGSESTGETLIWALSLLLNHPRELKIVQDELDIHIGKERWAEESDIKSLKYLQAVVKETLRLYPPGSLAGPHVSTEDCYVNGYYVPKRTRLIVNVWKLHRDPRVWSKPHDFEPERFLKAHVDVDYRGQNFEYIPFSSGRRMCPAITLASQVIHLTLARLLHGFEISTPLRMPVDMGEGLGISLPKVKPLEVILTLRLPMELYQNL